MSLSKLNQSQLVTFYELATRIWKYPSKARQKELLNRIVNEDYEILQWTETLTIREISFFKQLPPHLDFKVNPALVDYYLEFVDRIEEFKIECDAELQKVDLERNKLDQMRQEAHQDAIEESIKRAKFQKVKDTKAAYEQAEKNRRETYEIFRQDDDFSIFDLDFRITSNSPSDVIAQLMSQLGRTTVIISPGNWGNAFHTSERCEWLRKGRDRASKFVALEPLISVDVEDALMQRKRPCHSCFMFWWDGEINPNPDFGDFVTTDQPEIEIFLGDGAVLNQGEFEGFDVEVVDLLRNSNTHVKVRTISSGKEVEQDVPIDYLSFPENISEIRQERSLMVQRELEDNFRVQNESLRTLEELISNLEDGISHMTQSDLSELLKKVENRVSGFALIEIPSNSGSFLMERLNQRMDEARKQIS